ncbi:MAG: hypothetical protein KJ914_14315 [Gammaproteobacteria bacterium]|nr:hypothetical protein [Gammaproteobacteria bacterium]MBU1723383.1 hypothetical protein [Gammaproteobacteria bacterium]MBU2006965.1 hypothetical protein [Gammaproteobacteria bacterium]
MKKLIAGLGLTFLAVPSAQAWTGSIEDMRTMRANERHPVVRVKSHHVTTTCCGYQRGYDQYRHQGHRQQATGWQRSARVVQRPYMHRPARPATVHMKAYYDPRPVAQYRAPAHVHRIVGQAQPMCRYIR